MRRLREKEWLSGDFALPFPPLLEFLWEYAKILPCHYHARALSAVDRRSALRFPSEFIDIVAPFRVLFVPCLPTRPSVLVNGSVRK